MAEKQEAAIEPKLRLVVVVRTDEVGNIPAIIRTRTIVQAGVMAIAHSVALGRHVMVTDFMESGGTTMLLAAHNYNQLSSLENHCDAAGLPNSLMSVHNDRTEFVLGIGPLTHDEYLRLGLDKVGLYR